MIKVEGFEVWFKHLPNEEGTETWGVFPKSDKVEVREIARPYKGVTECHIKTSKDVEFVEKAFCSTADRFNKETGRKISLTRALRVNNFDKEIRTLIWNEYRRLTSHK